MTFSNLFHPCFILCVFLFNAQLTFSQNLQEKVRDKERRALTQITITADPFSPSLLEHSRAVSVLDKKELRKKLEPSLGETISKELGVHSTYFAPGASRPIVRANAGERVRILQNGIGTLDVSNTSEDHAVSTSPLTAKSVEILRGPETLLYGSSAIGGVVNLTDNSIPEKNIEKELAASFDLRRGSADDEMGGVLDLEGQAGGLNWHVDSFSQDTDDIDIPTSAESSVLREQEELEGESHADEDVEDGFLPNSASRNHGFGFGGSHLWGEGFLGAALKFYSSNYAVPGHEHHEEDDEHIEEGGVKIDLEQSRADLRGELRELGAFVEKLRYKLGVSNYEHKELEAGLVGTSFQNDALETRAELFHAPLGSFEGVLGLQMQASDFSASGEEAFLPSTKTLSPALFVFEDLVLDDFWKLQLGARQEFVNYDADSFLQHSFYPNSISSGVVFDPTGQNDYTLALSAAFSERAPAATELYADGAHIARQIFEKGDTSLNNEQSKGLDLTFKKNAGFVTGVFNLFLQDYNRYIDLAAREDESDGFRVFEYREIEALFYGFEAETVFHLHEVLELWVHDLDLRAQIDSVRAKDCGDDRSLPRIPPLRTIVALDYEYHETFGASVEGVLVEAQDRIADFELRTESYQLLNAFLTYKLPLARAYQLELYVKGTNLNDQEARVHSSFLKDLAPLRGRSVLLGLQGSF